MKKNTILLGSNTQTNTQVFEELCKKLAMGSFMSSVLWIFPDTSPKKWQTIDLEIKRVQEKNKKLLLPLAVEDVDHFLSTYIRSDFFIVHISTGEKILNLKKDSIDLQLEALGEEPEGLAEKISVVI